MAKVKIGLPSPQYLLNIVIALAILAFVMKMLPVRYTQYFKW
ncbi:hypothetical protein ES702_07044 [subsurface metagenome]